MKIFEKFDIEMLQKTYLPTENSFTNAVPVNNQSYNTERRNLIFYYEIIANILNNRVRDKKIKT